MISKSMTRMMSSTYSTLRNAEVGGRVTKAAVHLTGLKGTPIMPASVETLEQYKIDSPRQQFVIYFDGTPDILAGDVVVNGSENMPIRGMGPWSTDKAFYEVVVERVA